MNEQQSSAGGPPDAPEPLDSWKDIAAYLKRDVSTVQRWEKREGMPVHRHLHDKLGSVYAYPAELDAWWQSRLRVGETAVAERIDDIAAEPKSAAPEERPVPPGRSHRVLWVTAALLAVAIASTLIWYLNRSEYFWQNPLTNAKFVRLTEFEGTEHAAAISRDGRFVAFLADRDGHEDVWVTQVGSGQFHNLTHGGVPDLVNPDIRSMGFSADTTLVTFWSRKRNDSRPADIGIWAVPTLGGEPKLHLGGVAEFDWSSDGMRLVYHTPGPGDPMFVTDQARSAEKLIFTAPSGLHSHFPVWSPDGSYIYFVYGALPSELDIWRIRPTGGTPERITSHKSRVTCPTFLNSRTLLYLATTPDGGGPWLYSVDVERRRAHRISLGVERYTSLAASADSRRLVVTVANPKGTLWRVPITDHVAEESEAIPVTLPHVNARGPRHGTDSLFYVSSRSEAEGIWKLAGSTATELWSAPGARVIGGPAVAPDGKSVAFSAGVGGRARLYVMNSDGSALRMMPESIEPQGQPAWSPDQTSIAVAAKINDGAPSLAKVSPDGKTTVALLSEFAADPAWSRDGASIVYSGQDVGTTFRVKMVSADGKAQRAPNIMLSRGARRVAFLPGNKALLVLRGEMTHLNFWAIDLDKGLERRLTNFGPNFAIRDFDLSADGREIVFDRAQDNSDIVLIDR